MQVLSKQSQSMVPLHSVQARLQLITYQWPYCQEQAATQAFYGLPCSSSMSCWLINKFDTQPVCYMILKKQGCLQHTKGMVHHQCLKKKIWTLAESHPKNQVIQSNTPKSHLAVVHNGFEMKNPHSLKMPQDLCVDAHKRWIRCSFQGSCESDSIYKFLLKQNWEANHVFTLL